MWNYYVHCYYIRRIPDYIQHVSMAEFIRMIDTLNMGRYSIKITYIIGWLWMGVRVAVGFFFSYESKKELHSNLAIHAIVDWITTYSFIITIVNVLIRMPMPTTHTYQYDFGFCSIRCTTQIGNCLRIPICCCCFHFHLCLTNIVAGCIFYVFHFQISAHLFNLVCAVVIGVRCTCTYLICIISRLIRWMGHLNSNTRVNMNKTCVSVCSRVYFHHYAGHPCFHLCLSLFNWSSA